MNIQKAVLRDLEYFSQFKDTPFHIAAVFTNRKLNVSFHNQSESQIKNNRSLILSKLNLQPEQLVCAQQTHSANVYIAAEKDKGRGAFIYEEALFNMDAFITKEKNIALAVFIADCLPVFIFDKCKDIIAVVHAGWKGTKQSIVKKTIFVMQQAFESKPQDLVALLGPSIRNCCYEVGDEFKEYFKRGIRNQKNKLYLDVVEINCLQLKEAGVPDKNIFDCGICTCCQNDKFFSFRREKDACGRQMALIVKR